MVTWWTSRCDGVGSSLRAACFSLLIVPLYLFSLKELSPVEDTSSIAMIVEAAPEAFDKRDRRRLYFDAVDVMLAEPTTTYI